MKSGKIDDKIKTMALGSTMAPVLQLSVSQQYVEATVPTFGVH